MAANFIYVFRDAGYERGVKIGRGSSANLTTAQCFSPRGITFIAAWQLTADQDVHTVENEVFKKLGDRRFLLPGFCTTDTRTGREWFDYSPDEALDALSDYLQAKPIDSKWKSRPSPPDEYQSSDRKPGRMMIFVQEECETRALKVNSVSEWTSPRERQRRYSRNGFGQIAAYTYLDPDVTIDRNLEVVRVRTALFERYSCDPKGRFGWLPETADPNEVSDFLFASGLAPIPDIFSAEGRPAGVRVAYNKGTDERFEKGIPRDELKHFPSPWW